MIIEKLLKVEDLASLSHSTLIEAYRNGYKVEELPFHIHNNHISKEPDNYKNWKPLSEKELQEIRTSVNSSSVIDLKSNIEPNIKTSPLTSLLICPTTIIKGNLYQITIQASGGTPSYTFEMFSDDYIQWKDRNGNPWKYVSDSTDPISWYNTFSNSIGIHKIILRITDSNIYPSPSVKEDIHTIDVIDSPSLSSISTIST